MRNEVTAAAVMEILYEFDRLGTTVTPAEELARAKRFQTGIYLLRNETGSGVANSLSGYWVRGQDATALTQFVSRIDGVTAEGIRDVGRKYLASRMQTIAVVGDAKAIVPDLEQFGKVEIAPHSEIAGDRSDGAVIRGPVSASCAALVGRQERHDEVDDRQVGGRSVPFVPRVRHAA